MQLTARKSSRQPGANAKQKRVSDRHPPEFGDLGEFISLESLTQADEK